MWKVKQKILDQIFDLGDRQLLRTLAMLADKDGILKIAKDDFPIKALVGADIRENNIWRTSAQQIIEYREHDRLIMNPYSLVQQRIYNDDDECHVIYHIIMNKRILEKENKL